MNIDLKAQIRDYATLVEDGQEPVTVEEVRLLLDRRDETEPVVGLRPSVESRLPVRRPWPVLVAAAVVLIIFGVFVFVFPGEEPPSADTVPAPMDRELGYYVPADVPEGFVLQDMEASRFGSSLSYIRESSGAWLPGDGGFRIGVPFISPAGLPADPEEYLTNIVESNPGAARVEAGGRQGVVREVEYVDGPVSTTLISLAAVDEQGSVFDVVASGMTREEVLAVAGGVERVSVDEFVGLGSNLEWDLRMLDRHDSFEYEIVPQIQDWAREIHVVLGLDVLIRSSIARPVSDEAPVVTTEDGSVVEPTERPWRSSSANLYLDVPEGEVELIPHIPEHIRYQVSPRLSEELTDRYLERVGDGVVLSEDPYIIQAPRGPEPRFDVSTLGEELPLEPAENLDAIPVETLFRGRSGHIPVASEIRPVIVIGTARQPGSEMEPPTMLLWFTDLPGMTVGLAQGNGIGSGGASYPLDRYGIGNQSESRIDGPEGQLISAQLSYAVPLETSVVQIITEEGNFWQRPNAGYGAISYGDTVGEPTSIIALDANGDQIGEWEVPST